MNLITIQSTINASINKVWDCFTLPTHVINWNFASPDWHCPSAENDFTAGGEFHYTMAAKDGSFSFDFWGTFNAIENNKYIDITLGDGRKMLVNFMEVNNATIIVESFEAENVNPVDIQQAGWQAILDNFRKYVEA